MLALAIGIAGLGHQPAVVAQDKYPQKPINLIVPFPPGGGTDIVHRAAAAIAQKSLGQPLVVINKPGGAGVIGALEVERAAPDGYTLGAIASTALLTQYTAPNPNSWDRMEPIATLTYDAAVVAVRPDSPWKSLRDLVDAAKASPGKLNLGNGGAGTLQHMFAIALEQQTGMQVTHIPYPGGGQTAAALLGGQVDAISADIATAYPHAKAGRYRLLGIAAGQRHAEFPDVPLYREQGVDLDIGIWRLIVAPSGTPAGVIDRVRSAYAAAVGDPDFVKAAQGSQIIALNPRETARAMEDYARLMKRLANELQLRSRR